MRELIIVGYRIQYSTVRDTSRSLGVYGYIGYIHHMARSRYKNSSYSRNFSQRPSPRTSPAQFGSCALHDPLLIFI